MMRSFTEIRGTLELLLCTTTGAFASAAPVVEDDAVTKAVEEIGAGDDGFTTVSDLPNCSVACVSDARGSGLRSDMPARHLGTDSER